MPVHDLYSKRLKAEQGETADVYEYEVIPPKLRVQIVHIFKDAIGTRTRTQLGAIQDKYRELSEALGREHGFLQLGYQNQTAEDQIFSYIQNEGDITKIFDLIELALRTIHILRGDQTYLIYSKVSMNREEVINELNIRFKENNVGYEIINWDIVRIDSNYMHIEAIKPALILLQDPIYIGANAEFRKAFDKYKDGDNKNALVEALKSFESTLKAICDKRGWLYSNRDTASKLVDIALANNLVPAWQQEGLTAVRTLLGTVGTPRNKLGGHGQGSAVVNVPNYYVRYALNSTASAIILLAEADKDLP